MTAQAAVQPAGSRRRRMGPLDGPLFTAVAVLLGVGLVMVASASVGIADRLTGEPFHYFWRQAAYAAVGLLLGLAAWQIPLEAWERGGALLLVVTLVLLAVLLVPGLGRTVNGATRWLPVGPFSFQVSELLKPVLVIYLAGYLVRHGEAVRTTIGGFLKPMLVVGLCAALLLLQPDFGAVVVVASTALGMMFLGGVRLWLYGVLVALAGGLLAVAAISSPYRLERLTGFLNPWADPYNSGFQLTQALIAFGRGEWVGVGLGASVQKLFYLPEAHTDFVFAVLAEEFGLVGVLTVVLLFGFVVGRILLIGREAARTGHAFGAHLAYGIALWMGLQAFINIGVNMGLLPTKGLTLPLMSYGGSSLMATAVAIALALRVARETRAYPLNTHGGRS